MLKGTFRRWSLVGMVVVALGVSGGCVADEVAENADIVLEELERSPAPAGPIVLGDKTLVYSPDVPGLAGRIGSASLLEEKRGLVMDYLILQERVDCILEDIEDAAKNDTTVQCQGKVLVDKTGEHGLLGISQMAEEIRTRSSDTAKREYLNEYLSYWDEIQRIDRVTESLAQIKRSNAIPVFGALVKALHRFPILYEGDELVPRKDIPALLDQFRARDTDEARRALVMEYLER